MQDDQSDGGGELPQSQDCVVFIGSVPSKVPADVQAHASGFVHCNMRPETTDEVSERGPKRARLISTAGREIIGPRFSRGPTTIRNSRAEQKSKEDDRGGQGGLGDDAVREKRVHVAEGSNKQADRESTSRVNSVGDGVDV
jgi:hypothetical protein